MVAVKENKKSKHSYVFPDILAKAMSKVDQRTQFEASMMSMALMVIGLILTMVYIIIYGDFVLWFKIVMVINMLCGLLFMISNLITTFQSYQGYMEIKEYQNEEIKK